MAELTVVIPTLAMHASLRRVLDRLDEQDVPDGSFEVLVVADAAEPALEAVEGAIGKRRYPVQLLQGPVPGASANRNLGWQKATTRLIMFTDDDTLAEKQLLSEHLAWHRRHPDETVAVLGHVRWARELEVTPFMRWLEQGIQFDYPRIQGTEAGWGRFYTANVSVKRQLIERVGGFDESRLPYLYEDLDFAYRADKLGLRLLYNRNAVVEHLREMDVESWSKRVPRIAIAEREFVRLHPDVEPYYYRKFSAAAALPPLRGRGVRLARFVPPWVPYLGRRVWRSADMFYRQQLAPAFLAAWADDAASPP